MGLAYLHTLGWLNSGVNVYRHIIAYTSPMECLGLLLHLDLCCPLHPINPPTPYSAIPGLGQAISMHWPAERIQSKQAWG